MQYELLCFYFKDVAAKAYSYEWKRAAFFKFNASTKKNEALSNEPPTSMDTSAPLSSTAYIKSAEIQYRTYSQKLKAIILQ